MNRTLHKHISIPSVFLLFMLLFTLNGYAQEPAVRLMADSTYIGLGDPLTLTLSVKHPEGAEVTFPPFLDTLGGFEVLDVTPINLDQSTTDWVRSQRITVIRFDTGSFKIPSQKLMYQSSGTAEPVRLNSNPLIIDVIGIEVDTTQTYRPIKGIANVSYSWDEIWPWLLIVLTASAIIGYLVFRFTRKKELPTIRIAPPPVPPNEIAMRKLAKLEGEKLWQKGELKEYYVQLTGIIREYIEGLYRVPALESITDEIIRDLKQTPTPQKQLDKLAPFLQMADLAKFARFKPTDMENMGNMDVAREFIKETKQFYAPKSETPVEEVLEEAEESKQEVEVEA